MFLSKGLSNAIAWEPGVPVKGPPIGPPRNCAGALISSGIDLLASR